MQLQAVTALQVHREDTACQRIIAGRTDNVVKIPLLFASLDAPRSDFDDRRFVHVDEVYVWLTEELVEPVLERDALAAEGVKFLCGCELFSQSLVWQTSPDFVPPDEMILVSACVTQLCVTVERRTRNCKLLCSHDRQTACPGM